ncbi:MAG: hypothetical protein K6A90_00765 [Lachnospiraceae bacterium]|nr:hypothetical protein [Lachnospiraceae bacterium]
MTDNIEVFTQNSIRIRNGKGTIYIDPFQMNETPNDAGIIRNKGRKDKHM